MKRGGLGGGGGRPPMNKGKAYNDRPKNNNQCNVGKQQCCNPVNKSENEDSQFGVSRRSEPVPPRGHQPQHERFDCHAEESARHVGFADEGRGNHEAHRTDSA